MRPIVCSILATACWLGLHSDMVFGDTTAQTREQLQGTWVVASAQRNGEPATDIVGHQLTFRKQRFVIRSADGKRMYRGTFQVDPAQSPASIDFTHTDGELKGKTWKGIYRVAGDQLKVCDNAPNLEADRPKEFLAPAGSGHVALVLTRLNSDQATKTRGDQSSP